MKVPRVEDDICMRVVRNLSSMGQEFLDGDGCILRLLGGPETTAAHADASMTLHKPSEPVRYGQGRAKHAAPQRR